MEGSIREIGFRYFALVDHADLRRKQLSTIRVENYPEAWADHFVKAGLYAEDPVHHACLRTNGVFLELTSQRSLRQPAASARSSMVGVSLFFEGRRSDGAHLAGLH